MRKALSIGVVVICVMLLLSLGGVWIAKRSLSAAGVEQLDWQGLRFNRSGLHLAQLSGVYRDAQGLMDFQLAGLQLQLGGASRWRLAAIEAQEVQLDWQPSPQVPEQEDAAMPDPLAWASGFDQLPDRVQIDRLALQLPCATGRCTAQGQLQLNRLSADHVVARLALRADQELLELDVQLRPTIDALDLQAQLQLSERPAVSLEARWSETGELPIWEGQLDVLDWPQADWLLAYASPWLGQRDYPFTQLPTGLQASMTWALAPSEQPEEWVDLLSGQVHLNAELTLPQPWVWPEIGELQGQAELDVSGDEGRWQLRQGSARLEIDKPTFDSLTAVPAAFRPERLTLQLDPEQDSLLDWTSAMALNVDLRASGPVELSVAGGLVVSSRPQWQAEWQQLMLSGRADSLALDGLRLRGVKLGLPSSGRVNAEELVVQVGKGAGLQASALAAPEAGFDLTAANLDLSGLKLSLPLSDVQQGVAKGGLKLSAGRLNHALLKSQGWALDGQLDYAAGRIGWQGSVQAEHGLGMDVQFAWPEGQPWRADVALQEVFLRAANPLAATLADWPALLTFSSGRLTGKVQAAGQSGLDSLQGQLTLSGGKGIYDRLTFEGLTTTADISVKGEALQVDLPGLRLDALDPGLPLGPLSFDGGYNAALSEPAAGRLMIRAAQMGMLGGRVQLVPTTLSLADVRQSLIVELEGVELARLFEVYPAEGLSGRGTLDGRLPVSLEEGKLLIDEGQLQAREPGGFLRYRSEKLEDLARTNIGMRQVAAALDDFHYSVLSSDVAYDQDGLLVLGLQLQGRNPALEGGRPIHLNIRLEENMPALMASLQLSGQVSEIIQKRVQERVLQQRLAPAP